VRERGEGRRKKGEKWRRPLERQFLTDSPSLAHITRSRREERKKKKKEKERETHIELLLPLLTFLFTGEEEEKD